MIRVYIVDEVEGTELNIVLENVDVLADLMYHIQTIFNGRIPTKTQEAAYVLKC